MAQKSNHILFFDSLQTVLAKIQEQSPGLIVVSGSCEYFIYKALNAIKTVWKDKNASVSSLWEADELKKNTFVELCEQRNLFEKASLHIVRKVKKQVDFANWLASLNSAPQNLIVLSVESDKLNLKLSDAIKKRDALQIFCSKPFANEIPAIANQLLKKRKLHLEAEALRSLLDSVGEDLYNLENEIERLSLIFTDGQKVNAAQLAPFLNSLSEEQSFQLVHLLLEHKTEQAQVFINDLLNQGESPIGITGLIAWHCRNTLKMFEAARSTTKGSSPVRLSYTMMKGYQQYVRGIKPINVIHALMECQNVDKALKSTSTSPENLLIIPLLLLSRRHP